MEEGRAPGRGQSPARLRPLSNRRGRIRAAVPPVVLAAVCAAAGGTAGLAPQDRSLMLWGGVSPGGDLRLDPAFVLDAPASLPDGPGPYRIEVFGDGRASLFSADFTMGRMSKGGGGFVFTVPFRDDWPALERIVLTGPEGTAALDRDSHVPTAIVVDRASGRIRAILRGEAAEARIAAAAAAEGAQADTAESGTRVLVSYGLPRVVPE